MTTSTVRSCRVCGCTDERACVGSCWWVGPDLCSRCEPAQPDSSAVGGSR